VLLSAVTGEGVDAPAPRHLRAHDRRQPRLCAGAAILGWRITRLAA
jgi:hypothetical protein